MKTKILISALALALCSCGSGTPGSRPGTGGPGTSSNGNDTPVTVETSKISSVAVYVENSASMDGYVNGNTHFKNSLYHYLSQVEKYEVADTITLNYINSKVLPYKGDLASYIRDLSQSDFKKRGGDRSSTDIAAVWDNVLSNTPADGISILVSDFIISPGKEDANKFLLSQQTAIDQATASFLKKTKGAIIVYQLMSQFDGQYYDPQDKPKKISGLRPYYMFVAGSYENISLFREQMQNEKAFCISTEPDYKVENMAIIVEKYNDKAYKVKPGNSVDKIDAKDNHSIHVKMDQISNSVKFDMNVTLPTYLLSEEYVTNVGNYAINDPDYKVLKVTKSLTGEYTHTIQVSATKVKPSPNLKIGLIKQLPTWIMDVNDNDGKIADSNSYNMGLTYGIKYVVYGVNDAFDQKSKDNLVNDTECLAVFNLKINQ